MKTPIVNERIPCWPHHERAADIWLILTIILVCVGALCLAWHVGGMMRILAAGIGELFNR